MNDDQIWSGYLARAPRSRRWIRERVEDFNSLDDQDFITRYRLTNLQFCQFWKKIEHHFEYETDRNNCISLINQLLCTLRFYATGCFQTTAEDLCGFSSSTVNRIVHKVSCTIAFLRSQYIKFPGTPEEIRQTQLNFYRRAKFPRVIGAIDCTHVKLWQSPN